MKRVRGIFLGCITALPLFIMTACSDPETHVLSINLVNDLGTEAVLQLCKDDVHCGSTSDLWPAKTIYAKETRSFTVSNEETTVFKVTSGSDGNKAVRCLRVRLDKSLKKSPDLLLSSATGC